jgi:2,3,4,5-tetrahydropyridine-2-carboxylate N-succinyltransferase
MHVNELEQRILALAQARPPQRTPEILALLADFRAALNRGEIRVAEPSEGTWKLNPWVKKGIGLHLMLGSLRNTSPEGKGSSFELDTFPLRALTLDDRVRCPPGGSWIRDGTFLGMGVNCMPPVVINMGAYIGRGSVLDSHVSVGLGAQIGEGVHISSGTHIGGVVAPLWRYPNILGDDVVVGGNCGIYDGVEVGRGALLGAGTILTGDTRVYDIRSGEFYQRDGEQSLKIPPMAVVMMGARPITGGPAAALGLTLPVPIIVGYRDDPNFKNDFMRELMG